MDWTVQAETFMVKAIPHTCDKNQLCVAKVIKEALSNWPLYVMVVNMSSVPVNLLKNTKVEHLGESLLTIVPVQEELQIASVNAMPNYKEKQNKSDNLSSINK